MIRSAAKSLVARPARSLLPLSSRSASFWQHVPLGPKDPILGVTEAYNADPFEGKISVGVGAYRDDKGKPWILPSVQEAQKRIFESKLDQEYPPISGLPAFVSAARDLAYGADSEFVKRKHVAAVQSLSGTGALRLAGQFLSMHSKGGSKPTVLLPNPTWGNHIPIFQHSGCEVKTYRYWNEKTLGLDLKGMLADLKAQTGPAVVLLHSCAHNPTGVDPTAEQWAEISKAVKDAGHFVLFDNAYQGFASGSAEKDVAAIRSFMADGHKFGLCQSFAKNFGLYGQRIGLFSILCADADEAARVESQLKIIARAIYSNPPLHGARIVSTILNDPALKKQWEGEIETMSGRIIKMRKLLRQSILDAGSQKNWDHITSQIGMFSYTGLNAAQCKILTEKHHVYLTSNGRISMAGVTSSNVKALAVGIHEASR